MGKKFHHTIELSLTVFLLIKGFTTVTTAELYASYGENVLIPSPHSEVHEWQLPERNEILAVCTNGINEINAMLNRSKRLNITTNCSLQIQSFTKDDVGLYKCFRFGKGNSTKHTYEIDIQLRKLKIDEANDANVVLGTEGKMITLTCTLEGGSSNDMLDWIKNNEILVSGKSPSLRFTFMADPSDDMKEFICRGTNKETNYLLAKKVLVNLYLKPTVFITVLSNSSIAKTGKNVIVRKGQHMELKCQEKHKERRNVVIFSWLLNRIVLKDNTNMLVMNNINTEMSGEYICRAHNKAGIDYDAVNITVADIPETPRNVQVIAFKLEIIVKWEAGNSGGLLQTFLVKYRNRFKLDWNVIPAEGKTSFVIDGLQMDTVYFVRLLSRNIVGERNSTDDIIVKTGNQVAIQSCSWEIVVISSVAVVLFLLCLCGMKATPKRFCLNIAQNRSNISHDIETTHETHRAQYDEIDSVNNNSNINDRPEPSFTSTQPEILLLSSNGRNLGNIMAANFGTGSLNHELIERNNGSNILRVDNVSTRSSSDDSYLVPCQKYINFEIGITNEHSHQITEPEFLDDGVSASNSEGSETHIKSESQYETMITMDIVEHSYEST